MTELNSDNWAKAHRIAKELAGKQVDRNELGKILSYARVERDQKKLMKLVGALPQSGYVRSRMTREYYKNINQVLRQELRQEENDKALLILGWSFRLMTYYQTRSGGRRVR